MSPARLKTEIFSWCWSKTAKPKDFVISGERRSGLPAEIESIVTDHEKTVVRCTSFEEWGGFFHRDFDMHKRVKVVRTTELKPRQPRHDPSVLYVVEATLEENGASISYEILGGDMYPRRPNRVTVVHIKED